MNIMWREGNFDSVWEIYCTTGSVTKYNKEQALGELIDQVDRKQITETDSVIEDNMTELAFA